MIPKSCSPRTHEGFRVALVEQQNYLGGACINTGALAPERNSDDSRKVLLTRSRQLSGGLETTVRRNITLADFMYVAMTNPGGKNRSTARRDRSLWLPV